MQIWQNPQWGGLRYSMECPGWNCRCHECQQCSFRIHTPYKNKNAAVSACILYTVEDPIPSPSKHEEHMIRVLGKHLDFHRKSSFFQLQPITQVFLAFPTWAINFSDFGGHNSLAKPLKSHPYMTTDDYGKSIHQTRDFLKILGAFPKGEPLIFQVNLKFPLQNNDI